MLRNLKKTSPAELSSYRNVFLYGVIAPHTPYREKIPVPENFRKSLPRSLAGLEIFVNPLTEFDWPGNFRESPHRVWLVLVIFV